MLKYISRYESLGKFYLILGTSYLQDFCICTVNSVASPFVLHEIVIEAAQYLSRSSTAPLPQPLRSHLLTPLIQKCQQM